MITARQRRGRLRMHQDTACTAANVIFPSYKQGRAARIPPAMATVNLTR
jgi:hypothetical protein